jgi:transposase InsO family protein
VELLYLYVILDIFSSYVVGWMIALREAAHLAERLIDDTVAKHQIAPGTLTLHADRGSSMRSKPVAALLVDLEVTKTHSRPHVSPFRSPLRYRSVPWDSALSCLRAGLVLVGWRRAIASKTPRRDPRI